MGLDCVVIPSLILASLLSGVICLKSPRKRKMHYAIFIISLVLFSLFCSLNNFIIKRDQGDTVFFFQFYLENSRALYFPFNISIQTRLLKSKYDSLSLCSC